MATFLEQLANDRILGINTIDSVKKRMEESNCDLDDALEYLGIESSVVRLQKSQFFGIPEYVIENKNISPQILSLIPEAFARNHKALPLFLDENNVVTIGLVDPANLEAKNALAFTFGSKNTPYNLVVISNIEFKEALSQYTASGIGFSSDNQTTVNTGLDAFAESSFEKDERTQGGKINPSMIADAPAKKTVKVILENAVMGNASDIHIEPIERGLTVRYRVDGDLKAVLTISQDLKDAVIAVVKSLANLKLDERRKPQDNRFFTIIAGRKIDFRVSTLPTYHGEKIVMRILDPEKGITELSKTGMHSGHLDMVRKALDRPYGLILITGPTGSGKTSTLYSMLKEIDKETMNVVSLEDPIEYQIEGVSQSQVRPEIDYTFANGLRSILRQDPDVIMVGEIRDSETASLAIQAALTGHLVLATLHTNTAIGAIPRLVDMGIDPYLIAPTLIMAIAQRLSKRACPDAIEMQTIDSVTQTIIDKSFETLPNSIKAQVPLTNQIARVHPTADCPDGTKHRLGVFEMVMIDEGIKKLILEDPTEAKIFDYARLRGMLTMKEDAMIKSMKGLLPWEEINKL
jgi:type IV pilus assembly protein PilB